MAYHGIMVFFGKMDMHIMVLWITFIHHYITKNIPSGKHTKSELEHGHRNSEFTH